jgi:hypothetical protein
VLARQAELRHRDGGKDRAHAARGQHEAEGVRSAAEVVLDPERDENLNRAPKGKE